MNYISKSITTSPDKWFIVYYGDNWYGLKAGDGIVRGVPEGSFEQWEELIESMRIKEEFYSKRLVYEPGIGISSYRFNRRCNLGTSISRYFRVLCRR